MRNSMEVWPEGTQYAIVIKRKKERGKTIGTKYMYMIVDFVEFL